MILNSRFLSKSLSLYGLFALIFLLNPTIETEAQDSDISFIESDQPSPRGAFLRSLVLPGWGHQYIDKTDWTRGQYHMAADVAMILTYVGIRARSSALETNLETYAMSNAGTNLANRGREYRLAVSNFASLQAYNDYQLRARNWTNLIDENPGNQWNWDSSSERLHFKDMRERIDRNNNQLPGLLTLMVLNRVVSGLNAFVRARNIVQNPPSASFSYLNETGEPGFTANLRFDF